MKKSSKILLFSSVLGLVSAATGAFFLSYNNNNSSLQLETRSTQITNIQRAGSVDLFSDYELVETKSHNNVDLYSLDFYKTKNKNQKVMSIEMANFNKELNLANLYLMWDFNANNLENNYEQYVNELMNNLLSENSLFKIKLYKNDGIEINIDKKNWNNYLDKSMPIEFTDYNRTQNSINIKAININYLDKSTNENVIQKIRFPSDAPQYKINFSSVEYLNTHPYTWLLWVIISVGAVSVTIIIVLIARLIYFKFKKLKHYW